MLWISSLGTDFQRGSARNGRVQVAVQKIIAQDDVLGIAKWYQRLANVKTCIRRQFLGYQLFLSPPKVHILTLEGLIVYRIFLWSGIWQVYIYTRYGRGEQTTRLAKSFHQLVNCIMQNAESGAPSLLITLPCHGHPFSEPHNFGS